MTLHEKSEHNTPEIIKALQRHKMTVDKPSVVSDAFRLGWAARGELATQIKPHEWEEDAECGETPHPWDAATIFGTVSVYYDPPFGWLAIRDGSDDSWVKYPGRSGDRGFDTAADAMRFVDEYTAKRISDALQPDPITPEQAAEVLHHAFTSEVSDFDFNPAWEAWRRSQWQKDESIYAAMAAFFKAIAGGS